jgi:hypothetical protein
VTLRFAKKGRQILRNACVQRSTDRPTAKGLDFGYQGRELLAIAATDEHGKSFRGEFAGNGCADVVSCANDCD